MLETLTHSFRFPSCLPTASRIRATGLAIGVPIAVVIERRDRLAVLALGLRATFIALALTLDTTVTHMTVNDGFAATVTVRITLGMLVVFPRRVLFRIRARNAFAAFIAVEFRVFPVDFRMGNAVESVDVFRMFVQLGCTRRAEGLMRVFRAPSRYEVEERVTAVPEPFKARDGRVIPLVSDNVGAEVFRPT